MGTIYRVTIQGRTFESKDLKRLLARAVTEKRSLQRRTRINGGLPGRLPAEVAAGRAWTAGGCGSGCR